MRRMISSKNVTSRYIDNLFKKADTFKQSPSVNKWTNKVMVNACFNADTNASLPFESAMYRLGGSVIKYNNTSNKWEFYCYPGFVNSKFNDYGKNITISENDNF